MLRSEKPRLEPGHHEPNRPQLSFRELFLAVAPPPQNQSSALTGWPRWLVPTYRSGGQRLKVRLLEEDR